MFLFLGVDTVFFCDREEKLLLYLDVGGKIIYLLILIAMLFFALRKSKRNGGRTIYIASDDDGDTCSGEIAMTPTSLAVTTTIP